MVVRRDGKRNEVYYHCSRHYRPWDSQACSYRRFVPGSWDSAVWDFVFALLSDDAWIEEQLATEERRSAESDKLIEIEKSKIAQLKTRIARVQEGFESGIYGTDEAKAKIVSYHKAIALTEKEIDRLYHSSAAELCAGDADSVRAQLRSFAQKNLEAASFDQKEELIRKLDVRVHPSEDLRTLRVRCGVGINWVSSDGPPSQCEKIIFGPPEGIRTEPNSDWQKNS